ncbi:MAG: four helix bundle protein [Sphingobacteriales bacterium]|nr:MAG: four helix bundle protein [Sphingobacteriales bacterium]
MGNDIKYRCYQFSIKMIRYLKSKNWDTFSMVAAKQVMRSAMSVGANVVEAANSSSRIEFKRYYEIALKSSNETKYWFCIIRDGFEVKDEVLKELLKECDEISKILASSILTIKASK